MDDFDEIEKKMEENKDFMVEFLTEICKIPALSPKNMGKGEWEKSEKIMEYLKEIPFDSIEIHESPDPEALKGSRPNILAKTNGDGPALWIVSHIDIVPEGDLDLWNSNPFKPEIRNDRLYGRGVEDNGQGMATSLYALKTLLESGVKPKMPVILAFVADEETGSRHGIRFLLEEGLVGTDDLLIVPDAGSPDGTYIEIAEKSALQFRVEVIGEQVHASRPHKGNNAHRAGAKLMLKMDSFLHENYAKENDLFSPPFSTFEPTRKEENVPNVNTVPGNDIFYFDCRVLPQYDVDEIHGHLEEMADEFAEEENVKVEIDVLGKKNAPPITPEDSPVIKLLEKAIKDVTGKEAKTYGIGGGTCAAFFRYEGLPSAVWCTNDETAHEPNENIKLDYLLQDAKIFAKIMTCK